MSYCDRCCDRPLMKGPGSRGSLRDRVAITFQEALHLLKALDGDCADKDVREHFLWKLGRFTDKAVGMRFEVQVFNICREWAHVSLHESFHDALFRVNKIPASRWRDAPLNMYRVFDRITGKIVAHRNDTDEYATVDKDALREADSFVPDEDLKLRISRLEAEIASMRANAPAGDHGGEG